MTEEVDVLLADCVWSYEHLCEKHGGAIEGCIREARKSLVARLEQAEADLKAARAETERLKALVEDIEMSNETFREELKAAKAEAERLKGELQKFAERHFDD